MLKSTKTLVLQWHSKCYNEMSEGKVEAFIHNFLCMSPPSNIAATTGRLKFIHLTYVYIPHCNWPEIVIALYHWSLNRLHYYSLLLEDSGDTKE